MSIESNLPKNHIATTLSQESYNRQRMQPDSSDEFYVPLSDLRQFLGDQSHHAHDVILDLGCGGAPYETLFTSARYLKADFVECTGLDSLIREDGSTDIPSNSCDLVLSTQVLEHVFDPSAYLLEAFRVLKPGGKLILTTHGVWDDHGCPFDFWRWTADGLGKTVKGAGLILDDSVKLTTGKRAVMFLFGQHFRSARPSLRSIFGWIIFLLRKTVLASNTRWNIWMDKQWFRNRVVQANVAGHTFYLGLGITASKPKP